MEGEAGEARRWSEGTRRQAQACASRSASSGGTLPAPCVSVFVVLFDLQSSCKESQAGGTRLL